MIDKDQTHEQLTDNYQLLLKFNEEKLQILLKGRLKDYSLELTNLNIPEQVEKNFSNIEMIFEVLCERENYECDFESGEIEMKVFYFAKKEKKSRSVFLGLNECEKDENKNFKLLVFESKLRKLGNENEQIKAELEEMKKYQKEKDSRIQELGGKIEVMEQKLSSYTQDKEKRKKEIYELLNKEIPFLIQEGATRDNFRIINNTIQYIQEQQYLEYFIINQPMTDQGRMSLLFKILRGEGIEIGVLGIKRQDIQIYEVQITDRFGLKGSTGEINMGNDNYLQGKCYFSQEDQIELVISMEQSQIQWIVNKTEKVTHNFKEKKKMSYYPFIRFQTIYSKVKLI